MAETIAAGALGCPGHMPQSIRNAVIPALGVTFGSLSIVTAIQLIRIRLTVLLVPVIFRVLRWGLFLR